jgi:hypothetical protein
MAKKAGGGLGIAMNDPKKADGGGDPGIMKMAKKKTIGKISGDTMSTPRADRPRRAGGGAVLAPAAAKSPMATAAKTVKGGG